MRAFLTAVVVMIGIAIVSDYALRDDNVSASNAFKTSGVRLDAINMTNNLGRMPRHAEH